MDAIVLLSGGLDSATCLWWAKKNFDNVIGVSVNYFKRSAKEIEATKNLAKSAGVNVIFVDLPFVKEFSDIGNKYPIKERGLSPVYIPSKNILYYSVAANIAETMGINKLAGGHNKHDYDTFPDSSPEYIRSLNTAFGLASNIEILTPLAHLDKTGIIKLAKEMNVPIELTWTCHRDVEISCGECDGCKARLDAFAELQLADPIKYK